MPPEPGPSAPPSLLDAIRTGLIGNWDRALIKAVGGRFLAIGGAAATSGGKVTAFDGDAPKRVVVQVWDSMEKIKAWRANPEYVELRKIGEKYATFRSLAVDGVPQ